MKRERQSTRSAQKKAAAYRKVTEESVVFDTLYTLFVYIPNGVLTNRKKCDPDQNRAIWNTTRMGCGKKTTPYIVSP